MRQFQIEQSQERQLVQMAKSFDYHLDDGVTGLQLHEELGLEAGFRPCIIITADHDPAIRATVEAAGCFLLYKPLKPLALKAMMARLLTHADQGQR